MRSNNASNAYGNPYRQNNSGVLPPQGGSAFANQGGGILPPQGGGVFPPGGNNPNRPQSPGGATLGGGYGEITPGDRTGGLNAPGRVKMGGLLGGDIGDAIAGAIIGFQEGAIFGLSYGGKMGGAGSFIAGAVAQLVGYITFPVLVGIPIMTGAGFLFGSQFVQDMVHSYNETVGISPGHSRHPGFGGGHTDAGEAGVGDIGGLSVIDDFKEHGFLIKEAEVTVANADENADNFSLPSSQQVLVAGNEQLLLGSNSSDQELLNLQSAMSSFAGNSTGTISSINVDTGLESTTILLAASY